MFSSSDEDTSPQKKKYKLWKTDDSILIPLRTLQRMNKSRILNEDSSDESDPNDGHIESPTSAAPATSCPLLNVGGEVADSDSDFAITSECFSESCLLNEDKNESRSSDTSSTGRNSPITSSQSQDKVAEPSDVNNEDEDDPVNCSDTELHNISNDHAHQNRDNDGYTYRELLYENSSMTVDRAIVRLLDLYVRHKWTKSSLKDNLVLLQEMLPDDNMMPETIHQLFQYVLKFAPAIDILKHFYCKSCDHYAPEESLTKCPSCGADKKKILHFFEVDICQQIKFMFEHRNLSMKLKPRALRNDNCISDITDGSEYVRVNSRDDRGDYDLTLILNTDGLALVSSSQSHCWPLMFMIAELPEHLRESFLVTIGLWYDADIKPPMNIFLKPLSIKLNVCFNDGVKWLDPVTKIETTSKVIAPLIIADAPARAQVQNILNFNGLQGCNLCEIAMIPSNPIPDERTQRIYPYSGEDNIPLRSGSRMQKQALKLIKFNNSTKGKKIIHIGGVKGESILSEFPLLDLGTCLLPEFMHSGLLGIGRQYVELWLTKKGLWNLKKKLAELDKFMLRIRPPYFVGKSPRELSLFKFYKASEYYYWILYYSLPALEKFLPEKYLQHWILFVRALWLLLQDRINDIHLSEAEILLKLFVKQTEILYTDRAMTYNVHQLLHYVLSVKRWGPLWATSAFPFENFNGFLAHSVHGTKNFGQEIINNIKIAQGLEILRNHVNEHQSHSASAQKQIEALGKPIERTRLNEIHKNLLLRHDIDLNNVLAYSRAKIKNETYTSQLYKDVEMNSYTIEVEDSNNSVYYGSICFFFTVNDKWYIVLDSFNVAHHKMFTHIKTGYVVDHILPIEKGDLFLLRIDEIKSMFHLIRVDTYVCKRPNLFKKNL